MDKIDRRKKRIHSLTSPLPSKRTIYKIVKAIILMLVVWLNYWVISTIKKDVYVRKCGIVDRLYERDTHTKIIIMKYDDGEYSELHVTNSTYYGAYKGARLCFKEPMEDAMNMQGLAIFIGFILCLFYLLMTISYWDEICKPFEWLWNKLPE